MATLDTPSDSPNVTLTIRLIMQGKEVGSIIGKKGDIVKRFREESGAKINISDGSCPERIVTVTGNTESIFKAFTLICNKFEEDLNNLISPGTVPRPPITFRLVVPASQCGSLIGKGGSKIKEIREVTGASIQVASEMLPNSTERAVTISGGSEAVIQCIYHICVIMSESPPKGVTVPYTPLKAITVAGLSGGVNNLPQLFQPSQAMVHNQTISQAQLAKVGFPINAINGGNPLGNGIINPAALAVLSGQARSPAQQQTHEMTVPNELIGCIIGKGGSKVAEIRQLSGAMIRISNCEDRDAPANLDRTISITGNSESVALAQYLINMSMEVFRANLQLLEEQQIAAQNDNQIPCSMPQALNVPCSSTISIPISSSAPAGTQRIMLTDSMQPNIQSPSSPTSMIGPDLANSIYAISQSPNINNNNLQYPQTLLKPYMNGYPPVSMPELSTQQGFLSQIPMLPSNLMCPQQMRPIPVNHPVMLTNKLKAQPTLISISSARDHKFMPY